MLITAKMGLFMVKGLILLLLISSVIDYILISKLRNKVEHVNKCARLVHEKRTM